MYDTVQAVVIRASKVDVPGKDLDTENHELVDALTHSSAVHLQSSGPGLLATGLIHGFGARHTAVLWEEFNIQSPLNGTFDLGLITGFDKVSFTDRSVSAYLGTASLGGAIILGDSQETKTTEARLSVTSTENFRASVSHSFQISKLNSKVSMSSVNNNNGFDYKWAGEKREWLTKVKGIDIKWQNEYRFNKNLRLSSNIWISQYDRELPSSLASVKSFADQVDDNYRYQTSLDYSSGQYTAKLSYAHFDEQLNYKTVSVDSRAKNKVNALNFSVSVDDHKLNLSHRDDRADANFFTTLHSRKLSTFSYQYDRQWTVGFKSRLVLTEQLHDGDWSPFLFDVSTSYSTGKLLTDLSINSAYNTPTLNDLYWPQGGNPDLLPEQSYGADLRLRYIFKEGTYLSIEPYYKLVSNWILWSPGDQFWSPKNQRSVISKGVDMEIRYELNKHFSAGMDVTYINATIAEELIFKELEGKQLLYIPKVKANAYFNYMFRGFQVKPQALFVSQRYTTTDNLNAVPSFVVVDLNVKKQIAFSDNNKLDIGLTIYNLLNEDYQQIEFYPMPLKYFELNLNYKINRK